MKKTYLLLFVLFLLCLNIFCWQEVFVLASQQNLKVDFLDVGQGDSIFIETPQNHQILIDGGPNSKVLEKLQGLMPFWDKTIDIIVLTHPEKDHLAGLLSVLQTYNADYILWSQVVRDTSEYNAWADALIKAKANGAQILTAESGLKIKAGNVLLDTIYPFENLSGKELKDTSNDTCVVVRIVFNKNSFLFTGDISAKAEKQIVASESVASNVLKVSHHGSKYSTSGVFLAAVSPAFAVISDGKNNSYGHPALEVLQILDKFGIKVLRTDQIGDIIIESNGNNIIIK